MSRQLCSSLAILALMTIAALPARAETPAIPDGYEITDTDMSYVISLKGETVFEIGFNIGMAPFEIDGPRDMTGNGVPDLTVLWMNSRSTSAFAVFELRPEGLDTLFKSSGMTRDIVDRFSKLSDEDVTKLVSGDINASDLRPHGKISLPEEIRSQDTGKRQRLQPLGSK
ncbi:hypothetical protein [uncultured Cohaesibacter sp.]|uniref:hypothetical protein n=1 Tax=uncultured Cohaesibacter sp. TaxID=1002546 RepID=UPI0029C7537A|nr:hypothetical protein [uncultured Cohaesibacter sp.]